METNIQKPTSQQTLKQRELAKQKTKQQNPTSQKPESQQADQNIAKTPSMQPASPQDTKVEPPSMPSDRSGYQRCQDPLATMPRICNPTAMSNDRGPAAEGVAHKIYFEKVSILSEQI